MGKRDEKITVVKTNLSGIESYRLKRRLFEDVRDYELQSKCKIPDVRMDMIGDILRRINRKDG